MAKSPPEVSLSGLSVAFESSEPLHRQLHRSLSEMILTGRLGPGTRLPSTRELAVQLGISRNTACNAYEQLLADGYLEAHTGSGTYVGVSTPLLRRGRKPEPSALRSVTRNIQLSAAANFLLKTREPAPPIAWGAFKLSAPAVDLFPWATWQRLTGTALRRQKKEHLGYADPQGFPELRLELAQYLQQSRNLVCNQDQIFVVSGSQQAISLAVQVLLHPNDRVCIEDPAYSGALDAFRLHGMSLGHIPVDLEGFDVEAARTRFPDTRMVYVTPSHQYPLGVTMSLARRVELLEWATINDVWIVEDDYDSEYRYTSRPLSSMQGLDRNDRVIYAGTFSKMLFPSLRIGYLVVPQDLIEAFSAVRAAADIFPATLPQIVLREFIAEGHMARHLRHMRGIYAERLECLTHEVATQLNGLLRIDVADSGLHVVAFCSEEVDDRMLAKEAALRGVATVALSACYTEEPVRRGLVLGFGSAAQADILQGVKSLGKIFEAAMSKDWHPRD